MPSPVNIVIRNMSECTEHERELVAWYDTDTKDIVLIADHPLTSKKLPTIMAHELSHYLIDRKIPQFVKQHWILSKLFQIFIEEPFVFFYYQNKLLISQ